MPCASLRRGCWRDAAALVPCPTLRHCLCTAAPLLLLPPPSALAGAAAAADGAPPRGERGPQLWTEPSKWQVRLGWEVGGGSGEEGCPAASAALGARGVHPSPQLQPRARPRSAGPEVGRPPPLEGKGIRGGWPSTLRLAEPPPTLDAKPENPPNPQTPPVHDGGQVPGLQRSGDAARRRHRRVRARARVPTCRTTNMCGGAGGMALLARTLAAHGMAG